MYHLDREEMIRATLFALANEKWIDMSFFSKYQPARTARLNCWNGCSAFRDHPYDLTDSMTCAISVVSITDDIGKLNTSLANRSAIGKRRS